MSTTRYIPDVVPETIALDEFRKSLLGTWILWLQNDPVISSKTYPPNNATLVVQPSWKPDREVDMSIPCLTISRLQENFKSGPIGNYMTGIITGTPGDEEFNEIYCQRMIGTYQFDLLTRDLYSQWDIASYLDTKFQNTTGNASTKSFRVKDFGQRTGMGIDIPDSDVRVCWRPWRDVSVTESSPFNMEFEQLSYTIAFWCDLWYTKTDKIITNIEITEHLFQH